MKPWLKRTLISLFSVTALAGGLSGCVGHHHDGDAPMTEADFTNMRAKMLERAGKHLDLDDAQKLSLANLTDKLHAQHQAIMGGSNPRTELQALLAGPKFDRDRAQRFVEDKTTRIRSSSPELIAAIADFYDSLRPEQQHKLRDFIAKGHGGWGMH